MPMSRPWLKRTLFALCLLLLALTASGFLNSAPPADPTTGRAKLLSYMLRGQLATHHYHPKPIDDKLSGEVFDLFLKQLDAQKRFLLKKDVARLRTYAGRIDDEIRSGRVELPLVAAPLMAERVHLVEQMLPALLKEPLDPESAGEMETDPEKLDFCATPQELRERWRQLLRYQALNRYLDLLEEKEKAGKPPTAPEREALLAEARAKALKNVTAFLHRQQEETGQDYLNRYFESLSRAFDPHTNYLPPTAKEDFDIHMRGSLEGIGATLREEDGFIKVVSILPGGAASRQGELQAEDLILEVAQGDGDPVDVTDTRLRDAVSLIRGPKGSEVRLMVKKPDGRRLPISIIRDVVQIEETFVKSTLLKDPDGGPTWGYVRIPSFYRDFSGNGHGAPSRNSTDDVRRELEKLSASDISGLVVDLRNNGGGALTDAVAIAGLFFPTGPVVQVKAGDGKVQTLSDDDPGVAYDGPMVVLVNQFSASASEILAGALQDYGRAVILGSAHTHGKGTVQAVIDLDRNLSLRNMGDYLPLGALMVTIQKFYRVSGESTQARGVLPDIVLPDPLEHLKSGEQYLDHALPWDRVASVEYRRWTEPVGRIEQLRANSRERVAGDGDFAEIAKAVAQAKERSEKTRVSLRLADLRQERQQARSAKDPGGHGAGPLSTKEDKEKEPLADTLRADPYAREALAVLGDLLSGVQSAGSGGKVAVGH